MTAPAIRSHPALRWAGAAATVLCLLLAATLLIPATLGFQRYVIVSGSMTGTYDRGSIVYDKEVPVSDLKVGDPITYAPPPGASPEKAGHPPHRLDRPQQGRRRDLPYQGRRQRSGRSLDLQPR
jgi:signal peptidase